MTSAEGWVLTMATALAAVVFVEGTKGTITSRTSVFLWVLAMLAVFAALLHMEASVTEADVSTSAAGFPATDEGGQKPAP